MNVNKKCSMCRCQACLSSNQRLSNFSMGYYWGRELLMLCLVLISFVISLPHTMHLESRWTCFLFQPQKNEFFIIQYCKTKRPLKVLFCQNERLHCLQRYTMLWQITYVCCSHVPIWCVCVLFYVILWRDFFKGNHITVFAWQSSCFTKSN